MTPRTRVRTGDLPARHAVQLAIWTLLAAGALLLLCDARPGIAQTSSECEDSPAFHALDFWVGDWTVWADGEQVGTNRITKILAGCAIEEHWVGGGGGRGQSLFYYLPAEAAWRQVWVTQRSLVPGGVKEKRQIDGPRESVRFQGVITRPDGDTYLDRTTLTPLSGGEVRQHIEISTDGGDTWSTTFDAVYRPAGG